MGRPVLDPWMVTRLVAGVKGNLVDVGFSSGGKILHANVPAGELWGSVKDILVLEEYELERGFGVGSLKGENVVDLGAQVGLYSLKVAPFAKKVLSIEPGGRNFALLEENVRKSGLPNVKVERKAIWSNAGERVEFSEGGAGFVADVGGVAGEYLVETTTLDEVVESTGEVGLMKMDVEGAEYQAFESCRPSTLAKIQKIVAEVHIFRPEHPNKLARILASLEDAGFRLRRRELGSQTAAKGFSKPWANPLKTFDGNDPSLYRALLSAVYGLSTISDLVKQSIDTGSQFLLYASRA